MTLLVQEYLKNHSLADLEREHGVEVSIDSQGYKFSLNYNQITSKSTDKLANQCRGLILRTENPYVPIDKVHEFRLGNTQILAAPLWRFFNYGDPACANIKWGSAKILEKLDGSLCIVYFDDIKEDWCVATRSVPEANVPLGFKDYTFATLFKRAAEETHGLKYKDFLSHLDTNKTYCFELMSPLNRIVVKYDNFNIKCIAIRDKKTLKEELPEEHKFLHPVKEFNFGTIDEIMNFLEKTSPVEMEGFVVRDSNFNRIKIKSLAYVATHRIKDSVTASDRNIISLILEEKVDDALQHLPEEVQERIISIQDKVLEFVKKHEELYKQFYELAPDYPKEFADHISRYAAENKVFTAPLFAIYRNKAKSILDFVKNKKKQGKYPNALLDTILEQIGEK